jgi:hypothetical protein
METHFSATNGAYTSTRNFFPTNYFYWLDILGTPASSDTDTTLSLALKQFDQQTIRTTYSKPVWKCIPNQERKNFKK